MNCSLLLLLSFIYISESFRNFKLNYALAKSASTPPLNAHPRVEFEYCTGCRWMLRSAYMAQELLTTFEKDLGEVVLIPCKGEMGTFIIRIDDKEIWNRKSTSTPGFPDIKDLKQLVRDVIAPEKSLGHSDKKPDIITF